MDRILGFALAAAIACGPAAPTLAGTDLGSGAAPDFTLIDGRTGDPLALSSLRGTVVVLSFLYTRCPDVCPTTLADIAQALKELGPDASRVQVLMVSVDPERDTLDSLAKYVTAFDPGFIGLRGDLEATRKVAQEFKIYFEKRRQGDTYTVDHSAQSYVIDPQGELRLLMRHDRIAQDLAHDLRMLLRG